MIKKVALLGAGAVGSYIIWGLTDIADIEFGIVAQGERAQRLRQTGCMINDRHFKVKVWSPQEARGADLLIVALKYGALSGALETIEASVSGNTTVMSLMNGVDSEEIIAQVVNPAQIVYSVIKVASHRKESGVYFDPDTTIGIVMGEEHEPFDSARIRDISQLFDQGGIHYRVTQYIREEMWSKFRLNVCNNLPQAILGAGVGCYRDSAHMKAISDGLRRELEAVAAAYGIDMTKAAESSKAGSPVQAGARYSTLQDLDAGRHTEIDMFAGALMKMGKELGIATPYCEYTYHMIKALEEKNDGLFDY